VLFNQLIQEFPERKEGYFNRGLCLYKTEQYSEAILDLGTCLQMDSVFSLASVLTAPLSATKRKPARSHADIPKNFGR
jgi:hypothetical protein